MGRLSQMTGEVGQICCRKDLDRIGAQVIAWILKLLKDRRIGFPVIVENVPKNGSQLVNLTWYRCCTGIGGDGSWLSSDWSALSDYCG